MFPTQIGTVYRQDLDSVAGWLASTAKSRGYSAELLISKTWDLPPIRNTGGRLKGKERRVAKDAASAMPYCVCMADFQSLATFISRCKSPVISVPDSFFNTLDRVLCTRMNFGERLGKPNIEEPDKKYAPIVPLLMTIRDILLFKEKYTIEKPRQRAAEEEARQETGLAPGPAWKWKEHDYSTGYWSQYYRDKFPAMDYTPPIRDCDDEDFQSFLDKLLEPIERPTAVKNDTVNYVCEQSTYPDDLMFVFQILVHELNQIRAKIEWIWSTNLDTSAASLATSTAVKLARGLIDEVMPVMDKHLGGVDNVLKVFYTRLCNARGYKLDKSAPVCRDMFEGDRFDVANQVYYCTYELMDAIFAHTTEEKGMAVHGDSNEVYDPASDREAKSGTGKFDEDAFLIRELYAELMAAVKAMAVFPLKDELLWRMEEFIKTNNITFPFVFAVQSYLDINHVLRDDAEIIFKKSYDEASIISTHIDEYVKFHKKFGKDVRLPRHDEGLGVLRPWMELTKLDPIHKLRVAARQECGLPVPEHVKPHRMFIHSPVMTGIWLFQIRIVAYSYGLQIANTWSSITSCAHLYNTLLKEGLLTGEWTDMEVAMRVLGPHNIWAESARPRNLEEGIQNWMAQRGIAVSNSIGMRRGGPPALARSAPRAIVHEIPVTSQFAGNRTQYAQLFDASMKPSDVARIVDESFYKARGTDNGGAVVMEKVANFKVFKPRPRLRNRDFASLLNGNSNSVDRSASQLIHELTVALQGEAREVGFPWLVMHRYCWGLLRNIRKKCDPIFMPMYGSAFIDKELSLGELTTYCLVHACARKTGTADRRGLEAAAAVVNKMIASGKGKRAFAFSERIGLEIDLDAGKAQDKEEQQ